MVPSLLKVLKAARAFRLQNRAYTREEQYGNSTGRYNNTTVKFLLDMKRISKLINLT